MKNNREEYLKALKASVEPNIVNHFKQNFHFSFLNFQSI